MVWEPFEFWRLQLGYRHLEINIDREDRAPDSTLTIIEGGSPANQFTLRSSWNIGKSVQADAWLRWVSDLPGVAVDSYTELDLRLAWQIRQGLELAVTGQNLLHDSHQEFRFFTSRWAAPRGVYGRITWKF